MELKLPYPDGPEYNDSLGAARRKIAENMEAIARWARGLADDEATLRDGEGISGELLEGADEIQRFAEVVR